MVDVGTERRSGDWTKLATVGIGCASVTIAGMMAVFTIVGTLFAAWMYLNTRTTTSEISNASLSEKISKIEAKQDAGFEQINKKLDSNSDKVQDVVNENIRQDGDLRRLSEAVSSAEQKAEQALARATNAQIEAKSSTK